MRRVEAVLLLLILVGCSRPATDEAVEKGSGSGSTDAGELTMTVESTGAGAVVEHFKAQGLPVGRYDSYTSETSPFKALTGTHRYQGLAIFNDTRVEEVLLPDKNVLKFDESGGVVEVFASRQAMQQRVREIDAVRALAARNGTELKPEFQVRQGTILLRLGHVMEPWINEYEAALASYPS